MSDYRPPRFITRAEWLAHPPSQTLPVRDPKVLRGTVVHHQAARPRLDADPAEIVASIQRYHLSQGYSDIAYNTLVWHDGTVILGRDAGVRGAHTAFTTDYVDWNWRTLGTCILGDGDDPLYVTDAAWRSTLWCWQLGLFGTDGLASGLWAHHETTSPTHCAGDAVQARLDGLRSWLASGMPEVPA